jgi:hypothetical protein
LPAPRIFIQKVVQMPHELVRNLRGVGHASEMILHLLCKNSSKSIAYLKNVAASKIVRDVYGGSGNAIGIWEVHPSLAQLLDS